MEDYALNHRNSAYVSKHHPKNKRFAIEAEIQGWGGLRARNNWYGIEQLPGQTEPPAYPGIYGQRPTTPEETIVQFWLGLANGVTSFNLAEAFDLGMRWTGSAGAFHSIWRDSYTNLPRYTSEFNFGHHRHGGRWGYWWSPQTCESDSIPVDYYLGYSNTARAIKRAISRINTIYASGSRPFKRFEWLNAYSTHRALNWRKDSVGRIIDSLNRAGAFLDVFCTIPVEPWQRNVDGSYIDKIASDSAQHTFVEVGLFRDSTLGFGALLVNSRLWPDRDSADIAYYNAGLSSKDKRVSTLGDIDVRKVVMRIRPSNLKGVDTIHKSTYYVVRDIWHPDTCWLVHKDSSFAVYIRPGDAKFLYIEKAIAIKASPTAATGVTEFGFNNGRRVAERMKHTRSVVTYVRNDSLFVSYPAIGSTFEGYHERSSGDNIATGYERLIDPGPAYRPAICVSRNDTGLAMVYWEHQGGNSGRVKAAYQRRPGEDCIVTTYTGLVFNDATSDRSGVTPVVTPLDDTTWFVSAWYSGSATDNAGIVGLRFSVDASGRPTFKSDPLTYIQEDPELLTVNRSYFPTVASRPLPDSMYPVRIAWQKAGKIYERALSWSGANPVMTERFHVSKGLPSGCTNKHPSIALSGDALSIRIMGTNFLIPFYNETITWESALIGNPSSGGKLWPITRSAVQIPGTNFKHWGIFTAFIPEQSSSGPHYPIVSSENAITVMNFMQAPDSNKILAGARDRLRILWHNSPLEAIEGAHMLDTWYKSALYEEGRHVSQSQTTDSISNWTDSSMVNRSIVWVARPDYPDRHVRITNGWIPFINRTSTFSPVFDFAIVVDSQAEGACPGLASRINWEDATFSRPPNYERPVTFSVVPPNDYVSSHIWPVQPYSPAEIHTDSFTVMAGDSVTIPRTVDTMNVQMIRDHLSGAGDYVMFRMRLLRYRDSSYVATIDSLVVTPTAVRLPGQTPGVDANYATLKLPQGQPTDTVFVAVDMLRGAANTLIKGVTQYMANDEQIINYKRAARTESTSPRVSGLSLKVQPNPFSNVTLVSVRSETGLPLTVEIFDVQGIRIRTLLDQVSPVSETHLALEGNELSSGVYFVRATCGSEVVTRKLVLEK